MNFPSCSSHLFVAFLALVAIVRFHASILLHRHSVARQGISSRNRPHFAGVLVLRTTPPTLLLGHPELQSSPGISDTLPSYYCQSCSHCCCNCCCWNRCCCYLMNSS